MGDPRADGPTSTSPLALAPEVVASLRAAVPSVAERTVAALTEEVAAYGGALDPQLRVTIEGAVETALTTFWSSATAPDQGDPATPMAPALEAAYVLGRGEARGGRTVDGLLAAYRVGARVSWREMSATMVAHDLSAATVARLAELVFAYIDELSATSVAGHADELAKTGRAREHDRERLGLALLAGEPPEALHTRAERAGWAPPVTLTAVVLPSAHLRGALATLDHRTLVVAADVAARAGQEEGAVLLVPDAHRNRAALLRSLRGRSAAVGPTKTWTEVSTSHARVLRALELLPAPGDEPVDVDDHLVELVLAADAGALSDLRARALAPLDALSPASAARLTETLRSWLLHQGRREAVAADLHLHPQTVRYRMAQVRDRYGDRLGDPRTALELTVALALTPPPEGTA